MIFHARQRRQGRHGRIKIARQGCEMKSDMDNLVRKAVEAGLKAYAPYSKFRVGAALLADDGRVFQGCNVENASYGLSICAERAAICAAVGTGCRRFRAIAVVGQGERPPRPCGACLQAMSEFCDGDFVIVMAVEKEPDLAETRTLAQLLPERFRLRSER